MEKLELMYKEIGPYCGGHTNCSPVEPNCSTTNCSTTNCQCNCNCQCGPMVCNCNCNCNCK